MEIFKNFIVVISKHKMSKIVSEYDQEIPQSQAADKPENNYFMEN